MPNNRNSRNKQNKKSSSARASSNPYPNRNEGNLDTEQVVQEIASMPPEKQEAVFSAIKISGPLPPAKELQAYEQVVPGAADRIIKMAEDEALHRREQEAMLVKSSCGDSRLGLWLGFTIGMGALVLSGLIATFANTTAGSLLAFASISSLVGVFVYGSRKKREAPNQTEDSNTAK